MKKETSNSLLEYSNNVIFVRLKEGAEITIESMEEQYNVNALFILAAALHESDSGMSANAHEKNNLFGIQVFDSSPEQGLKYAKPEDSITAKKRDHLSRAARIYMQRNPAPDTYYRFDVVAITIPENGKPEIRLYKSAFVSQNPRR